MQEDKIRKIRKWGPLVNSACIKDNGEVQCPGLCNKNTRHIPICSNTKIKSILMISISSVDVTHRLTSDVPSWCVSRLNPDFNELQVMQQSRILQGSRVHCFNPLRTVVSMGDKWKFGQRHLISFFLIDILKLILNMCLRRSFRGVRIS